MLKDTKHKLTSLVNISVGKMENENKTIHFWQVLLQTQHMSSYTYGEKIIWISLKIGKNTMSDADAASWENGHVKSACPDQTAQIPRSMRSLI